MGSEEVISAMHAATQKLIPEQMIHPQMIDTGPPLVYPIPKDPAQTTLHVMYRLHLQEPECAMRCCKAITGKACP